MENKIKLIKLAENDIAELTPIMKAAFDADSLLYLGEVGGPTGYDDGSFLRTFALGAEMASYTIYLEDKIVGAVTLLINEVTQENVLENFFIDSNNQSKNIGEMVWRIIETMYPATKKWLTETPGYSRRNHHFYVNKCNFVIYKIKHPQGADCSYLLKKEMC